MGRHPTSDEFDRQFETQRDFRDGVCAQADKIGRAFVALAELIASVCPPSADANASFRHLRQAHFFAVESLRLS